MIRPRLLDLYCGAGGAAMGYHRAGFDVVGVDVMRQPRYPFRFLLGDALGTLAAIADGAGEFAAIHASPPCKLYTRARVVNTELQLFEPHPELLEPTRELLDATRLPWIIENVPEAPVRADVTLCGTMFGLRSGRFELRRHRAFELGRWRPSRRPPPCAHRPWRAAIPVHGHSPPADFERRFAGAVGPAERQAAMGIGWMTRDELSAAIPPAFTQWLGKHLLAHLDALQAVA